MRINSKYNVVVIEDDPTWLIFIESALYDSNFKIVGSANNLSKAQRIINTLKPDLLICDIVLDDSSVFSLIEHNDIGNIPILFMTSFLDVEYFSKTQKFPKSTFLAKPFHKFTLLSTLNLLSSKYPIVAPETEKFIVVRGLQLQQKKIMLNSITWLHAEGNYITINTVDKVKYAKKKSLSKTILELDERFIKIHKSYVINTDYIQRFDLSKQIVIINESEIPIGRGLKHNLKPILDLKN